MAASLFGAARKDFAGDGEFLAKRGRQIILQTAREMENRFFRDFAALLDEAKRAGVSLPVTALVDQFYAEVVQMGGRRWDTSSLLARLERK